MLVITFEDKIIQNILNNSEYSMKVMPYTKGEYFDGVYKIIIDTICKYYLQYSGAPSHDELKIELSNVKGINDKQLGHCIELIDSYDKTAEPCDLQWLLDKTEKFYQDRSLTGAIIAGANIIEKGQQDTGEILKLVQNALAVGFDSNLGHDYFNDSEYRYDRYHDVEDKVSWGIKALDDITNGGISKKNLACCIAAPGQGKSLFMCCIASNVVKMGGNVLYISLEMSEVRIAERIDANMFQTPINSIHNMPLTAYTERVSALKAKNMGRLIIKEYPTSSANVNHFRNLLTELKLKEGFIPDLVVIDYLNICASGRYKPNQTNSYGYIKAISEELRGLAVETNTAILTATQPNRSGFDNSDFNITDVSESIGITYTLDLFFALIRTPEMDEIDQLLIKQLKNRYSDLNQNPTVQLGINKNKMTVYDLNNNPFKQDPGTYRPQRVVIPTHPQETAPGLYQNKPVQPKNDFKNFKF